MQLRLSRLLTEKIRAKSVYPEIGPAVDISRTSLQPVDTVLVGWRQTPPLGPRDKDKTIPGEK